MDYQLHKLDCWNESRKLVVAVYQLLKKFPAEERFALCTQMRRAAISIPSNIAEGNGRISIKEQIHFLEIAYGSILEVYCQLQIAVDLGYITNEEFETIKPIIHNTSRMVSGLRASKATKIQQ